MKERKRINWEKTSTSIMLPITEIPELVKHYAKFFEELFKTSDYEHFSKYVTGLLVSENKTVSGINSLFALDSQNQSTLNRFINAKHDLELFNDKRLEVLGQYKHTKFNRLGCISIDDSILEHVGEQIEGVSLLHDHKTGSYVLGHNIVNLHYADGQTDYPIMDKLWSPMDVEHVESALLSIGYKVRADKLALKEQSPKKWKGYIYGVFSKHKDKHPEIESAYQTKLDIAKELLTKFYGKYPDCKLASTFDSWFTKPCLCNYIDQELKRTYVGTLQNKDKVRLSTEEKTVEAFAQDLKTQLNAFKPVSFELNGEQITYYCYINAHNVEGFGKVKLVVSHHKQDLSDEPNIYICNNLTWQSLQILRVRRLRWSIETFYQEAKAEGLDKYQVRSLNAIRNHIAFVSLTYSILKIAQYDQQLLDKFHAAFNGLFRSNSMPQWRKITQAQSLWMLLDWSKNLFDKGLPVALVFQQLVSSFF